MKFFSSLSLVFGLALTVSASQVPAHAESLAVTQSSVRTHTKQLRPVNKSVLKIQDFLLTDFYIASFSNPNTSWNRTLNCKLMHNSTSSVQDVVREIFKLTWAPCQSSSRIQTQTQAPSALLSGRRHPQMPQLPAILLTIPPALLRRETMCLASELAQQRPLSLSSTLSLTSALFNSALSTSGLILSFPSRQLVTAIGNLKLQAVVPNCLTFSCSDFPPPYDVVGYFAPSVDISLQCNANGAGLTACTLPAAQSPKHGVVTQLTN
ncbi:hypothetical protein F5884DRAFT_747400 [Xylogone sp. PMI_703]|nr:hypothetical protein F5884DRAFT_747400 [Xylogone sp. PMI_703]